MLGSSTLFRPRITWSIGVYLQQVLSLPPRGRPDFLLRANSPLRLPSSPHTRADPFLFSHRDRLYLFYETQIADDYGQIAVAEIERSGLRQIGPVLAEPFHLSYPCVFSLGETIYLLPESQGAGELRLYRFDQFPDKPVFFRTLMMGEFADPSPIFIGGMLYIFATTSRGLELFLIENLEEGNVTAHPCNPITTDPRFSRCGGMPFIFEGQLVRPAQNCAGRYGENLSLLVIKALSPEQYREEPLAIDLMVTDQDWNRGGAHHVSTCEFDGRLAVAVDGQSPDHFYQKFMIRTWMIATGRKRRT